MGDPLEDATEEGPFGAGRGPQGRAVGKSEEGMVAIPKERKKGEAGTEKAENKRNVLKCSRPGGWEQDHGRRGCVVAGVGRTGSLKTFHCLVTLPTSGLSKITF